MGDIHPQGNPHFQMDPYRILAIAKALATRLGELDPANAATYQQKLADFTTRWNTAIKGWEAKAAPLKGRKVVVHHWSWIYLDTWLGMEQIGALEPKPGVPPTSAHLASLVDLTKSSNTLAILRAAYQDPETRRLALRAHRRSGGHVAVHRRRRRRSRRICSACSIRRSTSCSRWRNECRRPRALASSVPPASRDFSCCRRMCRSASRCSRAASSSSISRSRRSRRSA